MNPLSTSSDNLHPAGPRMRFRCRSTLLRRKLPITATLGFSLGVAYALQGFRETQQSLGSRFVRARVGDGTGVVIVDAYGWSNPRNGPIVGQIIDGPFGSVLLINPGDAELIDRGRFAPRYRWS